MTFKHVKFEDSVTMRSLERLAKEKGLVESPVMLKKEASAPDYKISNNLMQNILKLCSGLRALGHNKFANDLEEKFILFKKADKLYGISSEKGEDLIDEAHPKGSYRLEGVEGDAVIETILDQHLKMVDVVSKKPNGKLASSKNILGAVKTVLGQSNTLINENLSILKDSLETILHQYKNQSILTRPISDGGASNLLKLVRSLAPENLTRVQGFKVKADLDSLYAHFEPEWFGGVAGDSTWKFMTPYFERAYKAINSINKELESKKNIPQPAPVPTIQPSKEDSAVADFSNQIKKALSLLSIWETAVQSDPENTETDKKNAMSWINKKRDVINFIKSQFEQLDADAKKESVGLLTNNLNKAKSDFEQFKKVWIG